MDRKLLSKERHEMDYARLCVRSLLKELKGAKYNEIVLIDWGKNHTHTFCAGTLRRICKLALRKSTRSRIQ
jgi:hypothetical protein